MVKINLSEDFYSADAVRSALSDFKYICDGEYTREKGRIKIDLRPKGDIKYLEDEFCNYVLGIQRIK